MTMQPAAHAAQAPVTGAWSISREGTEVAAISVAEDGGGVVVTASVHASTAKKRNPYRFDSLEAADAFVRDLLTSFTYLGCVVATS
jgi:hypothetical protein